MILAADTSTPIGARVVLILVTLVSLLFILRLVRYRRLQGKYALLWGAVGIFIGVFAIVPDVLVPVARAMGVAEGNEPAIVFFAAIAFLFLVVVQFSWELSRLEERSRSLAEEVALLRAELELRSESLPSE